MNSWLHPSYIAPFCSSAVLVMIFTALHQRDRRHHLALWAAGWGTYGISLVFAMGELLEPSLTLVRVLNQTFLIASILFLLAAHQASRGHSLHPAWIFAAALSLFAGTIDLQGFGLRMLAEQAPYAFFATAGATIGIQILRGKDAELWGRWLAGISFLWWGLLKLTHPFIDPGQSLPLWEHSLDLAFCFAAGGGILLIHSQQVATESRKREEEFRKQGTFLQTLLDAIPSAVYFKNVQGNYLGCNRAFEKMFGFDREEIIGATMDKVASAEQVEGFRAADRELLKHGGQQVFEKSVVPINGNPASVIFHKATFPDASGQPAGIIGTLVDISQRKAMEKKLEESHERFRSLSEQFQEVFDAISDPLVLLSSDLTIEWKNRAAQDTFRYQAQESSSYCYRVWRGRQSPCEPCPAINSFSSRKPSALKIDFPNGKIWEVRTFPLSGPEKQVILHMTDVTDQEKLQKEALRQAQLASLGELSAGVAHEINNPINGIINYADLLGEQLREHEPAADLAKRILNEGERIATIVRNLLSFARENIEEKKPASLYEILLDAYLLVEPQFLRGEIECMLDIPSDLPAVQVNRQQIQQVFINILGNALYALKEKNRHDEVKIIEICARVIHEDNDDWLRVIFKDYGTGIAEKDLSKIMNPFFTTKPAGKGTGLGLSISHGIIRDHGGSLQIESQEGRGTSVSIDLPVA